MNVDSDVPVNSETPSPEVPTPLLATNNLPSLPGVAPGIEVAPTPTSPLVAPIPTQPMPADQPQDQPEDLSIKEILDIRHRAYSKGKTNRRRKRGPQAAITAYDFFQIDALGPICNMHHGASPEEILALVAQQWNMLSPQDKQLYVDREHTDSARYSEEVKLYLPKALGGTMKRKKARKHPEAPKHPMSAYLYFVGEHRAKLKAVYPEKGFTEIARLLGEAWRSLPENVSAQYKLRATADKERYRKQKEIFRPRPYVPDDTKDKSKRKKHPLAPKHPLSAYLFYVATNRSALNAKHPDKDFTEIARLLGQQWKSLSATAKRKYEILAFADKKRYEDEKDKWVPPSEPNTAIKTKFIKSRKSKTAYSFWSDDERHKLAALHPHLSRKHLTKVLRQRWKLIPAGEKASYMELAERDKERAEKEAILEQQQQIPDAEGQLAAHLLSDNALSSSSVMGSMPTVATVDAIQNVIEASKLPHWNAQELAQFVSLLGAHSQKNSLAGVLQPNPLALVQVPPNLQMQMQPNLGGNSNLAKEDLSAAQAAAVTVAQAISAAASAATGYFDHSQHMNNVG
jgi:hypothetical protein